MELKGSSGVAFFVSFGFAVPLLVKVFLQRGQMVRGGGGMVRGS